jgi:hypothetical protein
MKNLLLSVMTGFVGISCAATVQPALAACHAASDPTIPAQMM